MMKLVAAALVVCLVATGVVLAGPVEDAVRKAHESVGQATGQANAGAGTDKAVAAIDSARAAVYAALGQAPLGFRKILFVTAEPEGFGIYDPRENNVFTPDEPMILYTEPIGLTWKEADGKVSSKLAIDFEIKSPDGKVFVGQNDFGDFSLTAREQPINYMAQAKIKVNGIPPGSYVLGLTVHDTNSDKVATVDLPFEVK